MDSLKESTRTGVITSRTSYDGMTTAPTTKPSCTLLEELNLHKCGLDHSTFSVPSSFTISSRQSYIEQSYHGLSQNSLNETLIGRSMIQCPYQKCKFPHQPHASHATLKRCSGCNIDEALMITSEIKQSIARTSTHQKIKNDKNDDFHPNFSMFHEEV
jgi:hypothetical protein